MPDLLSKLGRKVTEQRKVPGDYGLTVAQQGLTLPHRLISSPTSDCSPSHPVNPSIKIR